MAVTYAAVEAMVALVSEGKVRLIDLQQLLLNCNLCVVCSLT